MTDRQKTRNALKVSKQTNKQITKNPLIILSKRKHNIEINRIFSLQLSENSY